MNHKQELKELYSDFKKLTFPDKLFTFALVFACIIGGIMAVGKYVVWRFRKCVC